MPIKKGGGVAALILAMTYIFGFVLFFGLLDPSSNTTPQTRLAFIVQNRDAFFAGYVVIGVLFSFTLILLVQSLYTWLKPFSPELMKYAAVVGMLWSFIVLASSFVFLTSLGVLAKYEVTDPVQALTISNTVNIFVDALGGGIELVGAIWVLLISYVGIRYRVLYQALHYIGLVVGVSGVLTLFSGLSFLSTNSFFDITTALFGLGQIVWFFVLGISMLRHVNTEQKANYSTVASNL
ncbi:DUF4386 domain-containing protein [Pseudoalteromonas xiamenensis]|uniref:DUF4386 family protein n=1 Tax=Pseudoalteromonas xiamenensis TaxID=882626 RepID=UPI0027E52869|nr:DUF4386 family protein [Pseudoalteromonas xiamenensis]WMN60193.1 DUF4386 domain-containing protein [Pseudoalteromonas xiamenensis]